MKNMKWFQGPCIIFWEVVHDIQRHCFRNDFELPELLLTWFQGGGQWLLKWFQGMGSLCWKNDFKGWIPDHTKIVSKMISRGWGDMKDIRSPAFNLDIMATLNRQGIEQPSFSPLRIHCEDVECCFFSPFIFPSSELIRLDDDSVRIARS